jgi:tRNA pseudouridine55 synthase
MEGATLAAVREAAAGLTGDILQVPPMVSAIQVEGRRLHELAREGIEIERAARPVTVQSFTVEEGSEPGWFAIEVTCSSGTYIRSLAADVGTALGGGAHLRDLRRTAIGSFTDDQGVLIDDLTPEHLRSPAEALRDLSSITVDDDIAAAIGFGKVLPLEALGATGPGPWPLLGSSGDLLAVYEAHKDATAKPSVVLAAAGSS